MTHCLKHIPAEQVPITGCPVRGNATSHRPSLCPPYSFTNWQLAADGLLKLDTILLVCAFNFSAVLSFWPVGGFCFELTWNCSVVEYFSLTFSVSDSTFSCKTTFSWHTDSNSFSISPNKCVSRFRTPTGSSTSVLYIAATYHRRQCYVQNLERHIWHRLVSSCANHL